MRGSRMLGRASPQTRGRRLNGSLQESIRKEIQRLGALGTADFDQLRRRRRGPQNWIAAGTRVGYSRCVLAGRGSSDSPCWTGSRMESVSNVEIRQR
jgi:hypothetical protein